MKVSVSYNLFEYFKNLNQDLKVKHLRISDYDLRINGDEWSLYTDYAAWRIIKGKAILYTYEDADSKYASGEEGFEKFINEISILLIGAKISDILPLSDFMYKPQNELCKF